MTKRVPEPAPEAVPDEPPQQAADEGSALELPDSGAIPAEEPGSQHQAPAPKPEVPAPPPLPKTIFDIVYEATDVNVPKQRIAEDIRGIINRSGLMRTYDFVFLYDDSSQISRFTSNKIYSAVTDDSHDSRKPLFLLLHTGGGKVEPAYLISKCCRKTAPKFVAAVPRFAKSAGTLIALGADEIHMGIISELGPIDPQIGDYPALGLGSAVEHIAKLCTKHPQAVEMLAKYLASNLNLHHLGYFERVSESAVQYAERLLIGRHLPPSQTPKIVADRFVYGYQGSRFCDRQRGSPRNPWSRYREVRYARIQSG